MPLYRLLMITSLLFALNAFADTLDEGCLKYIQLKEWDEATKQCTLAAHSGSGASAAILGRIYEKGLNGEIDLSQAASWYDLAAQQNNKDAAYHMAELWLMPDDGLGYNPKKAAGYLEIAYHNGHIKAGIALAQILYNGQYMPKNTEASFRIYQDLSTHSRRAAYETGKMLMAGQGTPKNKKKAIQYYITAAQAHLTEAQRDLGLIYWQGNGIAKSALKAWIWMNIAASNGDEQAKVNIDEMRNQIPGSILREGDKIVQNWLKKNQP